MLLLCVFVLQFWPEKFDLMNIVAPRSSAQKSVCSAKDA